MKFIKILDLIFNLLDLIRTDSNSKHESKGYVVVFQDESGLEFCNYFNKNEWKLLRNKYRKHFSFTSETELSENILEIMNKARISIDNSRFEHTPRVMSGHAGWDIFGKKTISSYSITLRINNIYCVHYYDAVVWEQIENKIKKIFTIEQISEHEW